ncbi:hypothetical protein Tco_1504893 [Tanacetum coccineum]
MEILPMSSSNSTAVLGDLTKILYESKLVSTGFSIRWVQDILSTKTFYKHQDSRIMKAQELKTKTSAQTLIYKIFLQRYQVYQGRLLASFQDDAKYEHVGQDTRSQGGKDDQDKQGKDLKISDIKTKSKDNDKGSRSKITKHEGTSLQRIQRPRPQDLNDKSNLIDLTKECHNELTSGEIVSLKILSRTRKFFMYKCKTKHSAPKARASNMSITRMFPYLAQLGYEDEEGLEVFWCSTQVNGVSILAILSARSSLTSFWYCFRMSKAYGRETSSNTFRVILFSIHNDEWKSFQCHHQTAPRPYALSWKPCQGDSLNLPDHRIHKDGDGDASFQLKSDSLPHAHAQTTKTFYKHQDSRIMKAQELKTKTSAQTLIYKIFLQRYQVYQGRLLASFQDDAKYEHVSQDTRSQGGKDDQDGRIKI